MQRKIKKLRKKLNTEVHARRDDEWYYNNIYEDNKDGNNPPPRDRYVKDL